MKLETAQRNLKLGEIIKENIDNIRKIEEEVMNLEIMIEEGHLAIEEDLLATEEDRQALDEDRKVIEDDHQVIEEDLLAREMTEEEIIEGKKVLEIADEVVHMATEGEVGEEVIKTRFKRVIRLEDMKKKDQKVIQNLILSQNALQIQEEVV